MVPCRPSQRSAQQVGAESRVSPLVTSSRRQQFSPIPSLLHPDKVSLSLMPGRPPGPCSLHVTIAASGLASASLTASCGLAGVGRPFGPGSGP